MNFTNNEGAYLSSHGYTGVTQGDKQSRILIESIQGINQNEICQKKQRMLLQLLEKAVRV